MRLHPTSRDMLRTRVIPCLLIKDTSLVKTVRFKDYRYVGDPINTARIFNELEVDELILLDIGASIEGRNPNFELLRQLAEECFMPLAYGGGIRTLGDMETVFSLGFEKVSLNSAAVEDLTLVRRAAERFGSQSIIGSVDVKKTFLGRYHVVSLSGSKRVSKDAVNWATELQSVGVGEILLTSVDREGTWQGYDLELVKRVSSAVNVPVIAHGGAGCVADLGSAVKEGGASAVAIGSMVVFQGKDLGVLVSFPDRHELEVVLH